MTKGERLVSLQAGADELGISYETLRRWIAKGIVRRVARIGPRLMRIPSSELARLIREIDTTTTTH